MLGFRERNVKLLGTEPRQHSPTAVKIHALCAVEKAINKIRFNKKPDVLKSFGQARSSITKGVESEQRDKVCATGAAMNAAARFCIYEHKTM